MFAYEYDPANNLTRRTYPGSIDTDYTYDNDERLLTVTANSATTSYSYDEASNVTTITLPSANGHLEARVFDRSGRLVDVWNKAGSTTLSRFQLTLDPVGNPTQIVRSGTPSETRTYQYDNMDRLTEVCFQASACTGGSDPFVRWAYDGVGNRLTETRPTGTTGYGYDNDDRLTTAGSSNYSYDHNGNQTAAGSRTFSWDFANRLASTTLSSTTTNYTYTGDGRRASSTTGTDTTTNLWDTNQPLPQLAIERDGTGALLRRYTYGHDRIALTTPSGSFYFHYDDLRSVTNLTDTSGAKQWTYSYEPYGTLKTATQDNGSAPTSPMTFTGEQLDATGLIHLRARQYDPEIGRFTGRDPLGSGVGPPAVSGYAYVANMPTVLIDPSGLTSIDPSRRLRGLCLWCGAQEKAEELVNLIPPTVGGCVGASGGLGVGGFFELCLVSSNGALGVTVSGGTGFQTPSLSANLGGIGSNAQSVCDLTGWAGYAGASAGPGLVSVGLDSTVGRNAARRSIVTTTASVGLGFPTPPPLWFEHHGGLSRTWAIVGCDRSSPAGPSAGAK